MAVGDLPEVFHAERETLDDQRLTAKCRVSQILALDKLRNHPFVNRAKVDFVNAQQIVRGSEGPSVRQSMDVFEFKFTN